jgi:hypothetical protein
MKKIKTWQFSVTLMLIGASTITYAIHYLLFRDLHHIFFYLIEDLAFLFINVLLVILFIERMLAQREKRVLLKKLNMVIGIFFSEVGFELLKKFALFVEEAEELTKQLAISPRWTKKDFQAAIAAAKNFSYAVRVTPSQLTEIDGFLASKRSFLLRLLENPNLLEHERFTDLLWAVFHVVDELSFREGQFENLPQSDVLHLAGDLRRAYSFIVSEWIAYNAHLKESYPFLFSLSARINPLNPQSSPVVRS